VQVPAWTHFPMGFLQAPGGSVVIRESTINTWDEKAWNLDDCRLFRTHFSQGPPKYGCAHATEQREFIVRTDSWTFGSHRERIVEPVVSPESPVGAGPIHQSQRTAYSPVRILYCSILCSRSPASQRTEKARRLVMTAMAELSFCLVPAASSVCCTDKL
jgi:hypothetical protein